MAALAAGAAAATGLALTWNRIRNRERPSWTRPGPDEGLSPECVAALTQLRRGVDDVLGRLSDLQLARDGALRQAIAANAQAEFLDALSQRPGSTASTVAEGAGVVNTTSDVIGLGGSVLEGSDLAGVPAWVEEARRTLATADDMADAASALERQLARDLLLGRSTLIDPRVVAAYATQAKTGWTRGATAAATAAQRSTILKHLGTGLGVVSALAGVTGWVFGARHFDDLEQMGRWRGRAELRRAEADRWMGLAGEVSTRVADLEREFDTAIAAYNERARVCNAVPLTPPTWAQITEEFSRNALPVGADAPPSTAIETVLPTGPQPVPTDDRAGGCDRSVYDRLLQQYQQSLARRDDAATRHRTWAEHAADAKVAATAVEADRDRLRAYISESQNWWRGLNVAGLGATALPVLFTFSPPAAIVCGVVSIGTSLVSGAAVPNDMLVEMGRIDTIAQQLPVFVEQFRLERDRARRALDEADENARQRHFQLVMMHGRCSATTGAGWPESPPHPSLTVPIVTDGRPRPYVEIIRWH